MSNSPFNNNSYINMFFGNIHNLNRNMRNFFSEEYYDKLKFASQDMFKYLINEVLKYQTKDYTKADVIICYRNDIWKKYNKLMLEHLKFKNKYQIGVSLMCISNLLKKHNLYLFFPTLISMYVLDQQQLKDSMTE